jgi:hypothetical protein
VTAAVTDVGGIPVPSTDPVFLGIVGVHILFGVAAVLSGAGAMLSAKGSTRHVQFGRLYFWALTGIFVTMSALSAQRWREDWHLFVLGALAFGAAWAARIFIRRHATRSHVAGMGASYILMLTAFYVDNGKSLPLWRELPAIAYWVVPSAIGVPLMTYYLWRLPKIDRGSAGNQVKSASRPA